MTTIMAGRRPRRIRLDADKTERKSRGSQIAGALAVGAGRVIGWARRRSSLLPGLAGAGLASWGTAMAYLPAGVILGGVFLLAMDRQIKIRPGGE